VIARRDARRLEQLVDAGGEIDRDRPRARRVLVEQLVDGGGRGGGDAHRAERRWAGLRL